MNEPMNAEATLVSDRRRAPRAALGLALAFLVAGCSFLRAEPDRSRYFVLASRNADTASTAAPAADPRPDIHLGIGPVTLPGYLDTQALVRSDQGGGIEYIPNAYWAEAIDEGFARALLFRASSRIGTPHAVAFPWYSTTRVDWKVPVDVLRFEATSAGQAVLVARWSVIRTEDREVMASAETVVEENAGDDPVLVVAALNTCIDRLAGKIASAVLEAAPLDAPLDAPEAQGDAMEEAVDDSAPPSR